MFRRLGALVLAVAVGVVIGYLVRQANVKLPGLEERSAPGPVAPRSTVVKAQGRIEPHSGVIAVSATPGARIAAVRVKEGDEVEKDAILAELDGRLDHQREVAMIESQVNEARTSLKVEDDSAALAKDEIALEKEQADRIEPLEVKMQTATVEALTARKASETKELARVKGLRAQNLLSRQEEEQTELLLGRTSKELEAAQQLLEKLRIAHDLSHKRLALAQRKADVASARARLMVRLESLQKSLEVAQGRLDQTLVKAPVKGTVLQVHTHAGEVIGARPILQLGDLGGMDVVAEVHEDSFALIRLGQPATATSAALPAAAPLRDPAGNIRLTGKVSRIGWTVAKNDILSLDPAADAYARVVEVHIALDPAQAAVLKHLTNLQVTAAIDTAAADRTEGR